MNLKYNFSALKIVEDSGIDITNFNVNITSMNTISVLVYAGLKSTNKNITIEESDKIIDDIIEEMGFEKGMEYVANCIEKGFIKKK